MANNQHLKFFIQSEKKQNKRTAKDIQILFTDIYTQDNKVLFCLVTRQSNVQAKFVNNTHNLYILKQITLTGECLLQQNLYLTRQNLLGL